MSACSCPVPTPVLDELAGETVCSKCAHVLDSSMEQPGKNENYTMLGSRVPSSQIVGSKRMRRASQMANNVDQKRLNATYMAKSCCAKLGMPQAVEGRAMIIFDRFRHMLRGRCLADLVAATLYMACREHGVTRSLKEVAMAVNANRRGVKRAYAILHKSMDAALPVPDSAGFATRLASNLGLPEKTTRKALKILERLDASGRAEGRSPITLAAYAVYAALDGTEGVTQRRIAMSAGITDIALRLLSKAFGPTGAAS